MGYSYGGTFLVVFLTHPGVVIPSSSSMIASAAPGAAALIPTEGFPPVLTALWQVFCAWILGSPGNGSTAFAWTMAILYTVFIFLYMYFFLRIRMSRGI